MVLNSCQKAVEALDLAEESKKVLIADLDEQNTALSKQVQDLKDEEGAWYHNPFVMTSIGLVLGVIGGVWASRK